MKLCLPQTIERQNPAQDALGNDMLIGRLNVPVMRAANPSCLLFDYAQPGTFSSWTQFLLSLAGKTNYTDTRPFDPTYRLDIALGIVKRLDLIGADGVLIDTPLDSPGFEWECVRMIDEIQTAIHPRKLIVNCGDAVTWMGRTSKWKALTAITDYHFVEVFVDVNRSTLLQLAPRAVYVKRMINAGKTLILGVYDNGGQNAAKASTLMHGYENEVYWCYKISPTVWAMNPQMQR